MLRPRRKLINLQDNALATQRRMVSSSALVDQVCVDIVLKTYEVLLTGIE